VLLKKYPNQERVTSLHQQFITLRNDMQAKLKKANAAGMRGIELKSENGWRERERERISLFEFVCLVFWLEWIKMVLFVWMQMVLTFFTPFRSNNNNVYFFFSFSYPARQDFPGKSSYYSIANQRQ
jgi:hypothetical protein